MNKKTSNKKIAVKIIDTYPDFLLFWEKVKRMPLEKQIDYWHKEYMAEYPELLKKQLDDWKEQKEDWQKIAVEKIFPFLPERFTAMRVAHNNLISLGPAVYEEAEATLNFHSDITLVIYVGICGAGWVTTYQKSPAILFGLEGITEYGWEKKKPISGLISHEIGHIAHQYWRKQADKTEEFGPWWHLYEEGFAQYCESLVLGSDTFHQASTDKEWLDWCHGNERWLAEKFLNTAMTNQPVTPFFGSWFNIEGRIETGYFLGLQLIQALAKEMSLKEIALLENVEQYAKPVMQRIAEKYD